MIFTFAATINWIGQSWPFWSRSVPVKTQWALKTIGPAAVPALVAALQDDDDVRRSAAEALGRIGPTSSDTT
jgi:HEAT repeat protein